MSGAIVRAFALFVSLAAMAVPGQGRAGDSGAPSATVQAPAFELPYSAFASPQARQRFADMLAEPRVTPGADIAEQRRFYGRFNDDLLARMRRAFTTEVVHTRMGGVAVDVVTPAGGVSPAHRDKVLINLHGGAFMWGAGAGALLESIPIAATGGYKVVAVDYRLAPEHPYPAASEDAAAVYRELLKTYRAQDIGIYGCSAGGMLTAQATAWFQTHGLPRPGAIGTFCGSGIAFTGDS
ncbi:MAG: alpha/beta hydrolase, partial [Caulobacteraceae bacterium]